MGDQIMEDVQEDSIDLIDLLIGLGEEKWLIAKITAAIATLAVIVSLILTPMFTAKTTFIVPTPSAGASAAQAMANLGGLMASSGAASLLTGGKSPDEMYMEILKSKTLQNVLIEKFQLQERYKKSDIEKTQKELKNRTKITSLKKAGLISVEVEDHEPAFAAELANAYMMQLKEMLKDFAVTEAQQRKKFYEDQLLRTKREMAAISDYRELKVRETVLAVLLNQYEVALLDTAREGILQVTEPAVTPLKKSYPKRALMVVIATLAAFFLAIVVVLVRRAYRQSVADPEKAQQWQLLKSAWQLRR